MNYSYIISRAWQITFKYKFLWIFGIFAFLLEFIFIDLRFLIDINDILNILKEFKQEGFLNLPLLFLPPIWSTKFLASIHESLKETLPIYPPYDSLETAKSLILEDPYISILRRLWWDYIEIIFILIAIYLIFIILGFISKTALISGVNNIKKEEEINFRKLFKDGAHYFFRMFFLKLIISFLGDFSLLLFVLLFLYFNFTTRNVPASIFVGIISLILWLLILAYLSILHIFAERFIVIKNNGALGSLKNAGRLLFANPKNVLLTWLIYMALETGIKYFILSPTIFIIIMLVIGLYFISPIAGIIIGIILGTLVFGGVLLLSGIFKTFLYSFATLAYLELNQVY